MTKLDDLNEGEWVVIDMTTGTVLGTNLVICPVADWCETDLLDGSDDDIFEYGCSYGEPIYKKESE